MYAAQRRRQSLQERCGFWLLSRNGRRSRASLRLSRRNFQRTTRRSIFPCSVSQRHSLSNLVKPSVVSAGIGPWDIGCSLPPSFLELLQYSNISATTTSGVVADETTHFFFSRCRVASGGGKGGAKGGCSL